MVSCTSPWHDRRISACVQGWYFQFCAIALTVNVFGHVTDLQNKKEFIMCTLLFGVMYVSTYSGHDGPVKHIHIMVEEAKSDAAWVDMKMSANILVR